MGKLKWSVNVSPSSMKSLAECQRQWYLAKVLSWQGWNGNAPEARRVAYRCSKMDSMASITGNVVHHVLDHVVRRMSTKAGQAEMQMDASLLNLDALRLEAEERVHKVLSNIYRGRNLWVESPKRSPPIRELYHRVFETEEQEKAAWAEVYGDACRMVSEAFNASIIEQMAGAFMAGEVLHWRDMSSFDHEQSSAVKVPYGGPDSGVTLWGVLDLLLCFASIGSETGRVVVVDWKTGQERDEHERQAEWYAWAAARILIRSGVWSEEDIDDPQKQSVEVQMVYLDDIDPDTGKARVVSRDLDPWELDVEAIDRFVLAVENAPQKGAEAFPKRTGRHCDFCGMRHACTGSRDLAVKP